MKVTVRNLGFIKKAEIDLKPLTIFVGPNNAGKTWLAYTLAGIFGPYGFRKYSQAYIEENIPQAYPPLDDAIKRVLHKGSATLDLVQFAQTFGETYFNNVAHFAQQWMPDFMSTQGASFEHLDIAVDLAETKTDFLAQVMDSSLRSDIPAGQAKPLLSIRKKRGERKLYIYTSTEYASAEETSAEEQIVEQLPLDIIKEFLVYRVFHALHKSLYPYVRILPTERTAFITFPFGNRTIGKEPLTVKEKPAQNLKMRAMIGPVSSFLTMINTTFEDELLDREQREKNAKHSPKIKEYIQLAELLEARILNGSVNFSQSDLNQTELEPAREILFQPTEEAKLEISIASSMVKELSPLVLYLRYLATPGELLIIDEPEMNLHPEAQVKIIEFLAMLVNAGLNVLVTTHSPYIVDHLTNLLKAAEHNNKEAIRDEFYLKRTEAFIFKDRVSVYLIEDRQAKDAMDEDGTIQLNTFGEVSDRLSDIYFKL